MRKRKLHWISVGNRRMPEGWGKKRECTKTHRSDLDLASIAQEHRVRFVVSEDETITIIDLYKKEKK